MIRRPCPLVSAALLAVALNGCASAPKLEPQGEVVVPVHLGNEPEPVKVHLMNEVKIALPPLAKPREAWVLVYNDVRFLEQLHPIAPDAHSGFVAAFFAIHRGLRTIRFVSLPLGTREAVPTQTYELQIEIE